VGNITAAGVGLTLTASSTVVFAELPFRPSDATQGEDRACRIGASSDKVLVQHIILDGSLDVKLARMLIHKQNVCDKVLDK
jgi:SWI/SNF-related matrix-associated actin-dependent regulator of chromatin subfamily A-like protein 1